MQYISYNTSNEYTLEMLELYAYLSECSKEEHHVRKCMKPFASELSLGMKNGIICDLNEQQFLFDDSIAQHDGHCIVCFSGGKDSVATAIRCRELGYDVHLLHVHGINHSYPDEINVASAVAHYLDMPLHVIDVSLSGRSCFQENPVKNQVICAMALEWSHANGYGHRISFGDLKKDHRERAIYGTNWTDTIEMWEAFVKYMINGYDKFELILPFDNYYQTLELVSKDMKLLGMIQGCIAPYRYRDYWRSKNIAKYGDILLPKRCGSCWKCCVEYKYLVDNNIIAKNDAYYNKCLDIIKKKANEI